MASKTFRPGPGGMLGDEDLALAAGLLKSGKTIVFPTDTLYGLGALAGLPGAAEKLYALKERDPRKPLPILVHSLDEAKRWAVFGAQAHALAGRHWPGALTLVLEPTKEGRKLSTGGTDTLALRVPAHALTLALLAASGGPWVSSSANASGSPAAADAKEAARVFEGRADVLVLAGPAGGTASTVVDARGTKVKILRQGALTREEIARLAAVE